MAEALLLLARRGSLLEATVNRPSALNALTLAAVRALKALPDAAGAGAAAVLLRGAGGKAFCAGGDVRRIAELPPGDAAQLEFFAEEYFVDWELARHARRHVPHVALWDGIVMGGGVGISAHAPFRIATPRTLFAMPETAIGFIPDVGGSFLLPRLQPSAAAIGGCSVGAGASCAHRGWGAYLGLTGARLVGADAVHGGVATHYMLPEQVPAFVADLEALPPASPRSSSASSLETAGTPDYAVLHAAVDRVVKRHALPISDLPPPTFGSPEVVAMLSKTFDPLLDGGIPALRARLAAIAASAPTSGAVPVAAAAALSLLDRMSPHSLHLSFHLQRLGADQSSHCTLGSCLALELAVAASILAPSSPLSDFYVGVRSVLIDKSKGVPAWGPNRTQPVDVDAIIAGAEGGALAATMRKLRGLGSYN